MSKIPSEKEKQEQLAQQEEAAKKKQLEEQEQQALNEQRLKDQQAQAQPTWTSENPNANLLIKGSLKVITKEDLEKAGLEVTSFEKTDKGYKFKFKDDEDEEREINVSGNRIFINDFSQNTFNAVAKACNAMGVKGINFEPLASTLHDKEKEDVLYRAFKGFKQFSPTTEMSGLGKDAEGKDLLEKFAKEMSTAPKPQPK